MIEILSDLRRAQEFLPQSETEPVTNGQGASDRATPSKRNCVWVESFFLALLIGSVPLNNPTSN